VREGHGCVIQRHFSTPLGADEDLNVRHPPLPSTRRTPLSHCVCCHNPTYPTPSPISTAMSSPLGAGAEARPTHTFFVATHVVKVERVLRELGGGAFTGGQMPAAPTGAGYDAAGRRDAAADVDAVLVSAAVAAAQVTRNGGAREAQEAANVCGQAAVHVAVLDAHAMFFFDGGGAWNGFERVPCFW